MWVCVGSNRVFDLCIDCISAKKIVVKITKNEFSGVSNTVIAAKFLEMKRSEKKTFCQVETFVNIQLTDNKLYTLYGM